MRPFELMSLPPAGKTAKVLLLTLLMGVSVSSLALARTRPGQSKAESRGALKKKKPKPDPEAVSRAVRKLLLTYLGFPFSSVEDGELTTKEILAAGYRPEAIRAFSAEKDVGVVFVTWDDATKGIRVFERLRMDPSNPGRRRTVAETRAILKELTGSRAWKGRVRTLYEVAILRTRPSIPPMPARTRYRASLFVNGGQLFGVGSLPRIVQEASRNVVQVAGIGRKRTVTGTGVFARINGRVLLVTARHVVEKAERLRYRLPGSLSWVEADRRDLVTARSALSAFSPVQIKKLSDSIAAEARVLEGLSRQNKELKQLLDSMMKHIKRLKTLVESLSREPLTRESIQIELENISEALKKAALPMEESKGTVERMARIKLARARELLDAVRLRLFDVAFVRVPPRVEAGMGGVRLSDRLPGADEHMYAVAALDKGKRAAVCVRRRVHFSLLLDSGCSFVKGASGGPLLDSKGRLVAINFAIHRKTGFGLSLLLDSAFARTALARTAARAAPAQRVMRSVRFSTEAISFLGRREHGFLLAVGADFHRFDGKYQLSVRVGPRAVYSLEDDKWSYGGALHGMLGFNVLRRMVTGPFLEVAASSNKTLTTHLGLGFVLWIGKVLWVGSRVSAGFYVVLPENGNKAEARLDVTSGILVGTAL